ncbi:hypothetical protein GCM10011348_16660 [Marinobacterium nitratireducens]|uniref:ABC-2 type transporter transmembrane domain-containing protein n=1 Tax=Marinobacterium nitratireducens TaxID=518897 RepID=A0A918DSH2_9GAMM|nr:ABC transporter permease [Marinobacterium nitratireducens]GGO80309.1 hypothetical protein GCM10011348_16660 [Marinobacterium nitratireducens]
MRELFRAMQAALGRLFSDPASRATMVMSIIIYAIIYPQPYSAEVIRDVPVAVVDQDGSNASRELIRRIDAAEGARVLATVDGLPQAESLFYARRITGLVIVPANFERDLLNGDPAPIAAYGDAGYFLIYNAMMGAVNNAAQSLGHEIRYGRLTGAGIAPDTAQALIAPLSVTSVALFNPQGGYASYVVPAAFVLIVQQTLLMGIGILHAGRKPTQGVRMAAAPLVYVLFYCLWIAVTQLLLPEVYGIPRLGTWWHLYVVAIPFLMAVCALGFVLAQLIRSREGVIFVLVVMGIPLFFLSGVSWPIQSVPAPIQTLALLIPSTTALTAFVQVDQMGADLGAVADKVIWELTLAAAYTLIALLLNFYHTRRQPAEQARPPAS